MGFALHIQFQTQARRSKTGWCVIWWDAACTSSHSTGAAGVCSGSEYFAARPSGGHVFSFGPADSILWWWGFVESTGQIAIFLIATWWEAPYSHPQESFCSPVDTVSAFHHETCWCFQLISAVPKSYWVFGLRRIAKRVKRMCVSCKRQDSTACTQPMAPLPEERVNPAVPFAVTGLDHAGPLYWCDTPRKKYWVLLFTCGVVPTVHLELVDTLSTYDTVLAFRRLVARRGLPKVIYSDNAKGFVAAPDKILGQFGPFTPE